MSALVKKIEKEAKSIRDKILRKQKPSMKFPLRSLSNVRFDPKAGTSRWDARRRSGSWRWPA